MLNSVELVLMFLSMFPSITSANINAVGFLLGLSCQYDMLDLMFMLVNYGIGSLAMEHIDTLVALAECNGFDTEDLNKHEMTMEDLCEMLHAIVKPVLGQMQPAEMALLRQTQISGDEVLKLSLDELETLVKNWTRNVREDDERYERFGKLAEVAHARSGSKTILDQPSQIDNAEQANKRERHMPGPDERSKDEKLDAWSKIKMDDKTAAAIVEYCKEYAAAPMDSKLERSGRVEKEKMSGKRGAARATTDDDEGMQSYDSITTDSSGVCIGFSMSWRTITYIRPSKRRTPKRDERESTADADHGLAGPSCHFGDQDGMPTQANNQDEWTETSSTTGSGSATNDEYMDSNNTQDMPQSTSISTWEAKWQHSTNPPSLVGYYMRWEMHVTKHGMPRPAPITSTAPPESPIPGLTIEEVYETYADQWNVSQERLWRDALDNPKKQYEGKGAVEVSRSEYEQEPDVEIKEMKMESKQNVLSKAVDAVCSKLRGLFKL